MEPITKIVRYKVKKKKLVKVKSALSEFLNLIQKSEPGIMDYKILQEKDDPTRFIHIMSFVDGKAARNHAKTVHVKKLVNVLESSCKEEPVFTNLSAIKSNKPENKLEPDTMPVPKPTQN